PPSRPKAPDGRGETPPGGGRRPRSGSDDGAGVGGNRPDGVAAVMTGGSPGARGSGRTKRRAPPADTPAFFCTGEGFLSRSELRQTPTGRARRRLGELRPQAGVADE